MKQPVPTIALVSATLLVIVTMPFWIMWLSLREDG
ncbi:hypothetical protein Rctr197k_280 [Virus Rctr197k]|nr:hypothetical protein Rctr197k_280 [Virus Rctr197k]